MNGTNDAQPCHVEAPPQQDVYAKYQELLRIVLDQGAKGGVQLKSDQVGFEAKWRHSTLGDLTEQACLPMIQQPTVFSFLQATKSTGKNEGTRIGRHIIRGQEFVVHPYADANGVASKVFPHV